MRNLTSEAKNKILSGVVAGLGVGTVALLEIAFTPIEEMKQFVAVAATIVAAGLMRWYMFYEGTALGRYNQDDARKALRMSIILAVCLFGYGVALAFLGVLDWHLFGLFSIANLGLVFVEWVYGRRTSYTKPARVLILETRSETLRRIGRRLKLELEEKKRQVETLFARVDDLQDQITTLGKDRERDKSRISDLEEVAAENLLDVNRFKVFFETASSAFFIDEVGKFKICHECGTRNNLKSNNTKVLVCDNCGTVVHQKLEA